MAIFLHTEHGRAPTRDKTPLKKAPSRARSRLYASLTMLAWTAVCLLATGCHRDMWNQPKDKPLAKSGFFADGSSARPLVAGTVPFGEARLGNPMYTGVEANGEFIDAFPFPVTREVLERGHERFNIFCAQCHGRTGQGNGMIVQRGMKRPPSYHEPRLKGMPHGYYFDVITKGFGVMYSYASGVSPRDRWAITAYIRALQLSQDARPEDVPENEREALAKPDSQEKP